MALKNGKMKNRMLENGKGDEIEEMKKTVIIVIFILCLGGAIAWFIKGQTLSDTKADKQETLAQENGKQETMMQETGKQETDKQETDVQEIDKQEEKQEADGQDTSESISYSNSDTDQMVLHQSIGKIEYPLSDLHFNKNKEYRITLKDQTTGKVIKEYEDKGEFFKANKKEFSVMVSTGKSENSPYLLSIYEGEDCLKEIAYMALGNDMINDNWVTID